MAVLLHAAFLQTAWFGSFGILEHRVALLDSHHRGDVLRGVARFAMPLFYKNRALWVGLPLALATTVVWLVLCRWSLGSFVVLRHTALPGSLADASEPAVRYWLTQQIPASAFDFGMGITMANLVVRRQLGVQHDRRWTSPTAGTIYAVLGVALALVSMWRLGVPAIAHQYYFGGAVVTATTSGYLYYFLNQLAFAVAYGLLIGGVSLGIAPLRRIFSISPLAVFGVLGYSVYLIHMQLLYHFNTFPSIFFVVTPRSHFSSCSSPPPLRFSSAPSARTPRSSGRSSSAPGERHTRRSIPSTSAVIPDLPPTTDVRTYPLRSRMSCPPVGKPASPGPTPRPCHITASRYYPAGSLPAIDGVPRPPPFLRGFHLIATHDDRHHSHSRQPRPARTARASVATPRIVQLRWPLLLIALLTDTPAS